MRPPQGMPIASGAARGKIVVEVVTRVTCSRYIPYKKSALDFIATIGLIVFFATWATAHLTLAVGLASYAPRWRAVVSLIPPIALMTPYWGFHAGMRWRSVIWVVSAACYAASWVLALQ